MVQEVLLDTNALIDLMDLSCLDVVAGCPGLRCWVVENVRQEVSRPDQREKLDRLLSSGIIHETQVGAEETSWMEELATYAGLKSFLGDGEAASLAVARHRSWVFVSYEKGRLLREAHNLLGRRFWSTAFLLARMVSAKIITVDQLDAAVARCVASTMQMKGEHLSRMVSEARSLISTQEEPPP